jgi:hypothetical protein
MKKAASKNAMGGKVQFAACKILFNQVQQFAEMVEREFEEFKALMLTMNTMIATLTQKKEATLNIDPNVIKNLIIVMIMKYHYLVSGNIYFDDSDCDFIQIVASLEVDPGQKFNKYPEFKQRHENSLRERLKYKNSTAKNFSRKSIEGVLHELAFLEKILPYATVSQKQVMKIFIIVLLSFSFFIIFNNLL